MSFHEKKEKNVNSQSLLHLDILSRPSAALTSLLCVFVFICFSRFSSLGSVGGGDFNIPLAAKWVKS